MARRASVKMKRQRHDPDIVVGTSTEGGCLHDQVDTAIYQNIGPATHAYEQVDEEESDPTYDYAREVLLREANWPRIGTGVSQPPDETQPGSSTAEHMAVLSRMKEDNGDGLEMDAGQNRSSVTLTANPSYQMMVTSPVAQQFRVQHERALGVYEDVSINRSEEQGTSSIGCDLTYLTIAVADAGGDPGVQRNHPF